MFVCSFFFLVVVVVCLCLTISAPHLKHVWTIPASLLSGIIVLLGVENQDAEPGARLTCHLLLRLLDESTDLMSHDHSSQLKFPFKTSLDHHLLSAAHESIRIGAVLAVLKAMLKISEAGMSV